MATNRVYADGYHLSVVVTNPTAPVSGDPVRYGSTTGVALTDEGEGGNPATKTSVDFGPSVWDVIVDDDDTGGVLVGQPIYYHDTPTGSPATNLNNKATGANAFFGFAMEAIAANGTERINVQHIPMGLISTFTGEVGTGQLTDDSVTRAKLVENALSPFEIPFGDVLGADGADLAITETAGDFFRNIGTNQLLIDGEATINETEVSVGWFRFTLPQNYVSGGDVKIRAVAGLVDAGGEIGACTIDFEAREQANDGTVGADLVATAATAISTTFGAKDFVVTAAGLVAGDVLVCKMISSVVETAGGAAAAVNSRITKLQMLCDVK